MRRTLVKRMMQIHFVLLFQVMASRLLYSYEQNQNYLQFQAVLVDVGELSEFDGFPFQVTAVSGYGGLVDIISQFGSHLCTFRGKSLQAESH